MVIAVLKSKVCFPDKIYIHCRRLEYIKANREMLSLKEHKSYTDGSLDNSSVEEL